MSAKKFKTFSIRGKSIFKIERIFIKSFPRTRKVLIQRQPRPWSLFLGSVVTAVSTSPSNVSSALSITRSYRPEDAKPLRVKLTMIKVHCRWRLRPVMLLSLTCNITMRANSPGSWKRIWPVLTRVPAIQETNHHGQKERVLGAVEIPLVLFFFYYFFYFQRRDERFGPT